MSGTRFTASTRWYIEDDGRLFDEYDNLKCFPGFLSAAYMEYGAHKALAERDAELGRWRSEERPDVVSYPRNPFEGAEHAVLVDETTGVTVAIRRTPDGIVFADGVGLWRKVAAEYFAAQPVPEPKPWQDAQPGELWSLMTRDGDGVYLAIRADGHGFEFVGLKDRFSLDYAGITAGRRIWKPEVSA